MITGEMVYFIKNGKRIFLAKDITAGFFQNVLTLQGQKGIIGKSSLREFFCVKPK